MIHRNDARRQLLKTAPLRRGRYRRLFLAAAAFGAASPAYGQTALAAEVESVVDALVADSLVAERAAGMSIAVVRGGDILVMKAYGYADLEHRIPTPDAAVYEIGSITKQFTAAAILQLSETGKLSLGDDLTRYLPEYPTRGHRITIRSLFDHTSGIQDYTEMPEFALATTRALPRDSLVALFSSAPFRFAPGEAMIYNNSAYLLLGLIIEKVSGMPYAEYVERALFGPTGMADSSYCSEVERGGQRTRGHGVSRLGLLPTEFLDHSWPYAAGSLCSTVGDLVAWNRALHGGRIVSPDSYRELISPGTLNDGTRLRYASGVMVDSVFGRAVVRHGGSLPGYRSYLAYFPDDSLTIAVLINTNGPVSPAVIGDRVAEAIFGWPAAQARLFEGRESDYVGEYRGLGRDGERVVRVTPDPAGGLLWQADDRRARPLRYLGADVFADGQVRLTFVRGADGVTAIKLDEVGQYTTLVR